MSLKKRHTQLFISEFSNLKEKEIEQCKSKIVLLEKLMTDYPSQRTLTIKYQNCLLKFDQLISTNKELNLLKNHIYTNNNRALAS